MYKIFKKKEKLKNELFEVVKPRINKNKLIAFICLVLCVTFLTFTFIKLEKIQETVHIKDEEISVLNEKIKNLEKEIEEKQKKNDDLLNEKEELQKHYSEVLDSKINQLKENINSNKVLTAEFKTICNKVISFKEDELINNLNSEQLGNLTVNCDEVINDAKRKQEATKPVQQGQKEYWRSTGRAVQRINCPDIEFIRNTYNRSPTYEEWNTCVIVNKYGETVTFQQAQADRQRSINIRWCAQIARGIKLEGPLTGDYERIDYFTLNVIFPLGKYDILAMAMVFSTGDKPNVELSQCDSVLEGIL